MTVRFKGQTEYQKSFSVSHSRCASLQRCVPLAGLRSDQMGISREPCLQRRGRRWRSGPGHGSSLLCPSDQRPPPAHRTVPPAASRSCSVQKEEPTVDPKPPTPPKPPADPGPPEVSGPAPAAEPPTNPEPPSALAKPRPSQPDSQPQPSSLDGQKPSANEVNLALWKKAGLRSRTQPTWGQRSEHHRQFSWKEPAPAASPILTAEQVLYSNSRSIPPYKKNPVTMDTEYQRNFQGSVPPTEARLRKQPEHQRVPLFYTHTGNRKRREGSEKKLRPIQEEPAPQRENVRSQSPPRKATPTPPPPQKVQHRLHEGGGVPDVQAPQVNELPAQSPTWLKEIQELRQKAMFYRRRGWGTNFCRDHLSQLLSEHNALWEPTDTTTDPPTPPLTFDLYQDAAAAPDSGSCSFVEALDLDSSSSISSHRMSVGRAGDGRIAPTPPTERRQAWRKGGGDEGGGGGDERGGDEGGRGGDEGGGDERGGDEGGETDEEEGRLSTPTLKIQSVQRTHHDRTTPATGGAILVGKLRGTASPQPQRSVSAVSMAAKAHAPDDVAVLQKEAWPGQSPAPIPSSSPSPIKLTSSAACKPIRTKHSTPPPAAPPPHHCIQGTLRHPDFQHNGQLGLRFRDLLCSGGGDISLDEDDRLSVMSWRSAASCSMASSVLERAQKRRQEFWGKS